MTKTSRCDQCGAVVTDIDAGFSPALLALRHRGCGGSWGNLYGISEIADALGEDRHKIAKWVERGTHGIPPPDTRLSMGPVWYAATIEGWIRDRTRVCS